MYLIRDVFHCKPGHSTSLAERLKKTFPLAKKMGGFVSARVLVDYVTSYWTVVLEMEVESLGDFEREMKEHAARPEFREAMQGYMDEVDGGHREIFRIA